MPNTPTIDTHQPLVLGERPAYNCLKGPKPPSPADVKFHINDEVEYVLDEAKRVKRNRVGYIAATGVRDPVTNKVHPLSKVTILRAWRRYGKIDKLIASVVMSERTDRPGSPDPYLPTRDVRHLPLPIDHIYEDGDSVEFSYHNRPKKVARGLYFEHPVHGACIHRERQRDKNIAFRDIKPLRVWRNHELVAQVHLTK